MPSFSTIALAAGASVIVLAIATRTSRLACQIILTEQMKSLSVRIPPAATNWMGR